MAWKASQSAGSMSGRVDGACRWGVQDLSLKRRMRSSDCRAQYRDVVKRLEKSLKEEGKRSGECVILVLVPSFEDSGGCRGNSATQKIRSRGVQDK